MKLECQRVSNRGEKLIFLPSQNTETCFVWHSRLGGGRSSTSTVFDENYSQLKSY